MEASDGSIPPSPGARPVRRHCAAGKRLSPSRATTPSSPPLVTFSRSRLCPSAHQGRCSTPLCAARVPPSRACSSSRHAAHRRAVSHSPSLLPSLFPQSDHPCFSSTDLAPPPSLYSAAQPRIIGRRLCAAAASPVLLSRSRPVIVPLPLPPSSLLLPPQSLSPFLSLHFSCCLTVWVGRE